MREIKFRSFGPEGMIYSALTADTFVMDFVKMFRNGVLMQYTGLKDKNGVEIYEGDIVQADKLLGFVEFDYGSFVLNSKLSSSGYHSDFIEASLLLKSSVPHQLEVIGNIYENPELLEWDGNNGN